MEKCEQGRDLPQRDGVRVGVQYHDARRDADHDSCAGLVRVAGRLLKGLRQNCHNHRRCVKRYSDHEHRPVRYCRGGRSKRGGDQENSTDHPATPSTVSAVNVETPIDLPSCSGGAGTTRCSGYRLFARSTAAVTWSTNACTGSAEIGPSR